MQEVPDSQVGDTEEASLTASIDLDDLTIDFLGQTVLLNPSGLGYGFELSEDHPRELNEAASNEEVQFFSQISEIFVGRYDLCTGELSITVTELSRLSWNLTSDVSTSTTVSTLITSQN